MEEGLYPQVPVHGAPQGSWSLQILAWRSPRGGVARCPVPLLSPGAALCQEEQSHTGGQSRAPSARAPLRSDSPDRPRCRWPALCHLSAAFPSRAAPAASRWPCRAPSSTTCCLQGRGETAPCTGKKPLRSAWESHCCVGTFLCQIITAGNPRGPLRRGTRSGARDGAGSPGGAGPDPRGLPESLSSSAAE